MAKRVAAPLLAGLAIATAATAAPESLRRVSPFQDVAAAAPAAAAVPPGRYELRGVRSEGGVRKFCVFDTQSSRGLWVALGDAHGGIRVADYDVGTETLLIEADGQTVRLSMKKPQIVTLVAPPSPAPAGPAAANPGAGAPAVTPVTAPTEQEIQERRNRIVEELRRRRALRQAAAQGGPAPQ